MPDHLPVTVKPWFFSRSERAFSLELAASLRGTASPHVRLDDVFLISQATEHQQSVLGRLRDNHVDVLIFDQPDLRRGLDITRETVARLLAEAIQERGKPKILIKNDGSTRPVVP